MGCGPGAAEWFRGGEKKFFSSLNGNRDGVISLVGLI